MDLIGSHTSSDRILSVSFPSLVASIFFFSLVPSLTRSTFLCPAVRPSDLHIFHSHIYPRFVISSPFASSSSSSSFSSSFTYQFLFILESAFSFSLILLCISIYQLYRLLIICLSCTDLNISCNLERREKKQCAMQEGKAGSLLLSSPFLQFQLIFSCS